MSIRYKLFGKPRAFDEFVDKAKKKGINKVDVVVESYDNEGGFFEVGHSMYHCYVGLVAGKIRLKLNEHTHLRSGHLYHTVIGKAVVERETLKEAIETAEKLSNLGFAITINEEPASKTKEAVTQYDKGIQEMCQKYGCRNPL